MPLGIVSEEEFNNELQKNDQKIDIVITRSELGRNGSKEVPQVIREIAAEEAIISGNNENVAKTFKISKQSLSAYKHGATSEATYNETGKVKARERIKGRVQNRMLEALNFLTDEKIMVEGAKNISSIVKDLAIVAEKVGGKSDEERGSNIHVHLHGPGRKLLNDADIIDIG